MEQMAETVIHEVAQLSCDCLDACMARIRHCTAQLSEEQVWWRPQESMNSVANLVLHLAGNVRQWIVSGIGGAEDVRERPSEFSARGPIPSDKLLNQLQVVVDDAKSALLGASTESMLSPRRIQGFNVDGFGALFDCVPHFKGHTQEIICLTRMQLGDKYKFYWQPQTAEEGSP